MNRLPRIAALLGAAALAACGKDAVQSIAGPVAGSQVKFFNFAVGSPGVNFYANDTKVTALSSTSNTESTTGTTYGKAAVGGYYTSIAPGQYTLAGRSSATADSGRVIAQLSETLANGKHYSYYMSGVLDPATKTSDAFVVEDPIPTQIVDSMAYVRFVNAVSNADAMTLFALNTDTTVTTTEIAVGGAVAYKDAGEFVPIRGGVYNLSTRYTGSSTNVISRTKVGFSGGRVYTITAGGQIGSASPAPFLDNTANR